MNYYKKRGQAWGFDLIVASIIFLSGMMIFYTFSFNSPNESENSLNDLSEEGQFISDTVFSDGFPDPWTSENVITPGIMNNDFVNSTKFNQLYQLSKEDYNKTKSLLNAQYDFFISSSEKIEFNGEQIDGIGAPPNNARDIVKITRIKNYNNRPATFNIYVWR